MRCRGKRKMLWERKYSRNVVDRIKEYIGIGIKKKNIMK